jgi:glycosyltransferase involved in cell wall biosynthesis
MRSIRAGTGKSSDSHCKIGILHSSLNPCAGAERLALVLCKALKENKFEIELVVPEETDWKRIKAILGIGRESIDREIVIPPFIRLPTIYSRFVYWLLRDIFFSSLTRGKYDLTITTNSYLPIVFSDVIYIHNPDFVPDFYGRYYPKYSSGLMRAYFFPFRMLCGFFIRSFRRIHYKPLILTNSSYIHHEIQRYLNVQSLVVYPPVDSERYSLLSQNKRRDNIVLTIGRFDEAKNLRILPELARRIKEATFVVLGSAGANSGRYINNLLSETEQLGVRNRVSILPNAKEEDKVNLLSRAKIYLHTMRFEHFGISIVEAMSAGLVPVVHRSGGPWIDILGAKEGAYGYTYESVDEAVLVIANLLENEKLRMKVSKRAVERARSFDSRVFKKNMVRIVRSLTEERTMKR